MGHIPEDAKWYLAEVIMEITVSGATRNVVHRNLLLVRADTPEEAYEKAVHLGHEAETSYDNPKGQFVEMKFRGIAKLDVMYEDLEDGAELMFEEHIGVSSQQIEAWIPPKEHLQVFLPLRPRKERDPDYRSQDILERVAKQLRDSKE